jgi:hypothetical protein
MGIDDFHFRDFQRAGDILIKHIDTKVNPADHFTKPVDPHKLREAPGTTTGDTTEFPASLYRALFHEKTSTDPLPDTPISQMMRNTLQREADTNKGTAFGLTADNDEATLFKNLYLLQAGAPRLHRTPRDHRGG